MRDPPSLCPGFCFDSPGVVGAGLLVSAGRCRPDLLLPCYAATPASSTPLRKQSAGDRNSG